VFRTLFACASGIIFGQLMYAQISVQEQATFGASTSPTIGFEKAETGSFASRAAVSGGDRSTYVQPLDKAFPHLVQGGGWETILVLMNLGTSTVKFDLDFYNQSGKPMQVTFRSIPEGVLLTTSNATGTMGPGASLNIRLLDDGSPLQIGWSNVLYDSTNNRIGGYAIFRRSLQGKDTDFEALVPLSGNDDTKFYMPFDNLEGFVTSMAVLNAGSLTTTVRVTILDWHGKTIGTDAIVLPPRNQQAFAIPERYPITTGTIGSLLLEGSTNFLSGLGFRFNPKGAFATIPIMNWSGMFK